MDPDFPYLHCVVSRDPTKELSEDVNDSAKLKGLHKSCP